MTVKIKRIKHNFEDKAVTLATAIIKLMGADFDGDQVNLFRIFGLDLGKHFSAALNPMTNFYIDRMTGRIDMNMMPIKDETAAFWALNNI